MNVGPARAKNHEGLVEPMITRLLLTLITALRDGFQINVRRPWTPTGPCLARDNGIPAAGAHDKTAAILGKGQRNLEATWTVAVNPEGSIGLEIGKLDRISPEAFGKSCAREL